MNEAIRQQVLYEILKALCSSAESLDYTPQALVKRAEDITDELSTRFRVPNAS